MSLLNHHFESPSLALVTESVDQMAVLKQLKGWLRRWLRHRLCFALNGGHELYRAHTDTRLYQQCLLCGYETAGWTIERRDRRGNLAHRTPSVAGR